MANPLLGAKIIVFILVGTRMARAFQRVGIHGQEGLVVSFDTIMILAMFQGEINQSAPAGLVYKTCLMNQGNSEHLEHPKFGSR